MPKKSDLPLETITINVVAGDKDILKRFYPPPVGHTVAIRALIHEHVKTLLEEENRETAHERPSLDADQLNELLTKHGGVRNRDDDAEC